MNLTGEMGNVKQKMLKGMKKSKDLDVGEKLCS